MVSAGFREEVFNVVLAQLLADRAVVSVPEQALRLPSQGRRLPDVLVVFQGLRTIIEGKVNDHSGASQQVLQDAANRVEEGIAHIGIAVLYPATLRQVESMSQLRSTLEACTLQITIFTEHERQGWTECDVDYLSALLRRTFDQLVEEDVVAQAVAALEEGVDNFTSSVRPFPAVIARCAEVLGIGEPDTERETNDESQ